MKNNSLFYLIPFLIGVVLYSCADDDNTITPNTEVSFASVFGIEDFAEAVELMGDYAIFGANVNGGALIKQNTLQLRDNSMNQSSIFVSYIPDLMDRTNRADGGRYIINQQVAEFTGEGYEFTGLDREGQSSFASSLFGNEVSIQVEDEGQTFIDVQLNAPTAINQLGFERVEYYDASTNIRKWDKSQGLPITWNADPLNKNGVLVVLSSNGDKIGEITHGPKPTTYNILMIEEDDGSQLLPSSVLDGFETNQLFTLTLYRGGFSYLDNDATGDSYKFYALSSIEAEFVVK